MLISSGKCVSCKHDIKRKQAGGVARGHTFMGQRWRGGECGRYEKGVSGKFHYIPIKKNHTKKTQTQF